MIAQIINHEDCDILGYSLVSELYVVDDLHDMLCLVMGLEFKHSRSSQTSFDTIGLPNGKLLLTFKYYDYDARPKTN